MSYKLTDYYAPSAILARLKSQPSTGIFYIRVKSEDAFLMVSEDFNYEFLSWQLNNEISPDPLVVYIGKANPAQDLYCQLQKELLHTEYGTFFCSLGAVMGKTPRLAETFSEKESYCFNSPAKDEIIEFINENFEVAILKPSYKTIASIELNEKNIYAPIFNARPSNIDYPRVLAREIKRCRKIARGEA